MFCPNLQPAYLQNLLTRVLPKLLQKVAPGLPARSPGDIPVVLRIVSVALILTGCESLQLTNNAQDIEEVLIPELRGVLLQAGQPAAGVRLRVSQREGEQSVCEIPFAEASAGSEGEFLFPVVNGDLSGNVFDRVSNDWQICVAKDDLAGDSSADATDADTDAVETEALATRWQQIWYDSHAGVMFGEKFTELACDLDKIPTDDGKKKSFFSRFKEPPAICVIKAKF